MLALGLSAEIPAPAVRLRPKPRSVLAHVDDANGREIARLWLRIQGSGGSAEFERDTPPFFGVCFGLLSHTRARG